MIVSEISKYCELYAERTFIMFLTHITDSENLGNFNAKFVIDFINSYIGVDNALDNRMPYDFIKANVGILTYHYAKQLDIVKLETPYSDIGLSIGQSCVAISRETLAEIKLW